MPFNKRKQEKQQHAQDIVDSRIRKEQAYETAIKMAEQITDPAMKVIALSNVAHQINTEINAENHAIEKTAGKKVGQTTIAGLAPAAAGGVAIGIFAGPAAPIAAPVAALVWAGSIIVGGKRAKAAEKKMKDATETHRNHITEQANRAYRMADAVIETKMEEISQSSLFMEVKALPGNDAKCAAALANYIAALPSPDAEEAPPAKAPPVEAAPKKKLIIKDRKQL